ncbi:arginyl-tRNA synthetase [Wigglesworthia glossinidia endosymbiont of Glossina morsitans morsitans (Yale colony)]|uniref:Arginine--tRNA ligase n=1 Tax=Wigglesworthia glossinidia endosymbiont of Glossina morsitans morsitans (Yale colony) TaxID=1142511 RepID=H6Q5I3_WIGGL|nr:arginine--tRNA ligase [Wigglesworthia glossinidia]AFA41466.1 arginyl-tRNA synthetase [Wigglesworthia glossinidia endosymbiont of Glossina morsitans morsitans (Yale colony)]
MNIKKILFEKIKKSQLISKENYFDFFKVKQSKLLKFGHYQIDGVLRASRKFNIEPKKLANEIIQLFISDNISEKIEFVQPGYINFFLKRSWIEKQLYIIYCKKNLGIFASNKKTVVIDYSSPNIGKEMHVGHIRSTIIGDSIARILNFLGHRVIKANHVGDWGIQFGMLLARIKELKRFNFSKITCSDLDKLYCEAKQKYDSNETFKKKTHYCTLKLQKKNKNSIYIWKKLVDISLKHNQNIYAQLHVSLNYKNTMGESLYNDIVPNIITDLKKKKLATIQSGNTIVILNEFKNKNGSPMGVILKKSNGIYLYAATDIACIKYRYDIFKANKIIYYTDLRQSQHLSQTFIIVRKAKYIPSSVQLEHHTFGMILKKDGTPFKTRSGNTIKLLTLLKQAKEKAKNLIINKKSNISSNDIESLSQAIGIGAIKYFELSKNRTSNYVFDWKNMLNFHGNTAPYMQYAYARMISLLRKNKYKKNRTNFFMLNKIEEENLAILLLQFEENMIKTVQFGMPNILCNYLYNLSKIFSKFYEKCPILHTKNKQLKISRLQLILLTIRTLRIGLNLLGIPLVNKM